MKLIRAARLVPVVTPPIDDGALLIQGDRLVDVGHFHELHRDFPEARITDLGDAILLPPLANAHTHLELTRYHSWADGRSEPTRFVEWIQQVIDVKRQLELDMVRRSLIEGQQTALELGTAFVGDILSLHTLGQTYRESPLRGRLFYETLGVDPERTNTSYAHLIGYMNTGHVGHMQTGVSPHSPYTLSPDYLQHVLHSAHAAGWPLAIHLAESPDEVEFIRDSSGPMAEVLYPFVGWQDAIPDPRLQRPGAYLQTLEPSQAGDLLVHGVQLDAEEIDQVAATGSTVVLCPRSNAKLHCGTAPVAALLANKVPLALGTDSLASNDSLSMWDEMAAACRYYPEMSAEEVVKLATIDGAKALGLPDDVIGLAPKHEASYLVLRPETLPSLEQAMPFLCRGERGREIEQVVLQGKPQLPVQR